MNVYRTGDILVEGLQTMSDFQYKHIDRERNNEIFGSWKKKKLFENMSTIKKCSAMLL